MIRLMINGRGYEVAADPDTPLLWVLREDLRLTGTKYACGVGSCGACTVLVEGRPQRACVTPLRQVVDRPITTIEGIPADHAVKLAWLHARVPQCGYCQPGMIMQTIGLWEQQPRPTLPALVQGLRRHLCRCGTYPRLRQALEHLLAGDATRQALPPSPALPHTPRFGPGLGLVIHSVDNTLTLAAVAERRTLLEPPVWLWLTPDNILSVVVNKAEMGQGVHTALALVAAAALDHPWGLVQVETAPASPAYHDPRMRRQLTGGSTSIAHMHQVYALLGATARELLREAAGRQWGVPFQEVIVRDGRLSHPPSGRGAPCGDLALAAAALPVPTLAGESLSADLGAVQQGQLRPDLILKVNGMADFGLDQFASPMLYGVVARPPAYGAVIHTLDTARAAARPGVRGVVRWQENVGVAADTLIQAWQARDALEIRWSAGSRPDLDDEALLVIFQEHLTRPGTVVEEQGGVEAALDRSARRHTAEYLLPYLAHATLEPMNCLADVRPDFCEVWAPLQNQTAALAAVQELTGLPPEQILIHTTFLGGGFGRRLEVDYVVEAVRLSQAVGQPVKLVWTREEDFRYDFFRPMTATRIRAGLDAQGRLMAWDHTVAAPAILARLAPAALRRGYDPNTVDGLTPFPYACPHFRLAAIQVETPIPVGFWRSVGHSHNAFTVESAIDELAHLAGQDPLAFRLAHLPPDSRPARLLAIVAEQAGWGTPLPEGWGRGLAQHYSFGSYVAQVAEVSMDRTGDRLAVRRVVCAVDCGRVVHPDTVIAQMEGGIIFGLSAALAEQVRFAAGSVANRNFRDYRLLTLPEAPVIQVVLAPSGDLHGGVGEPGVPPAAPALANAVFAATGRRLRRLPLHAAL